MTLSRTTCMACGGSSLTPILEIERVPVLCNQLCRTREEALSAMTAPIHLTFCQDCSHIFNAAFDGSLIQYGPDYENSLHHSARFREYASELVASLASRHNLDGGTVVEVGCGNGDFLRQLCDVTGSSALGFDPSIGVPGAIANGVVLTNESFFEAEGLPVVDLVCNRHVLEHVDDPEGFVSAIAAKVGSESCAALYLEVPNALYTIRDLGIWDLIYEHPSYFTPASLERLVRAAGFDCIEVKEAFEGQFVGLHASLGIAPGEAAEGAESVTQTATLVERFARAHSEKTGEWETRLAEACAAGQEVVLWGAGSKGSTFLNILSGGAMVERIIDINPAKHGRFVAGTGTRIVGPLELEEQGADVVVLMNPVYRSEVERKLREIGSRAELLLA